MSNKIINLLVIVGQTGSGKTDLAIKLAKKYNGELISADSRSVYKGMDIGTAKPSKNDLKGVVIWGLDLIEPDCKFTVYDFQKYTNEKINEIRQRGKLPILVGGSGMYIDSVILNYQFVKNRIVDQSVSLEEMTLNELQLYCINNNIELPENLKNRRYLINSILNRNGKTSKMIHPDENTLVIGLDVDKNTLEKRLKHRAANMLSAGIIDEGLNIANKYGWDIEPMKGNAYSLIKDYLENNISSDDFINLAVALDKKLAKKQRTWFKRNIFINWLEPSEVEVYIASKINSL
jgi:tRNA dimethylallyltransferase